MLLMLIWSLVVSLCCILRLLLVKMCWVVCCGDCWFLMCWLNMLILWLVWFICCDGDLWLVLMDNFIGFWRWILWVVVCRFSYLVLVWVGLEIWVLVLGIRWLLVWCWWVLLVGLLNVVGWIVIFILCLGFWIVLLVIGFGWCMILMLDLFGVGCVGWRCRIFCGCIVLLLVVWCSWECFWFLVLGIFFFVFLGFWWWVGVCCWWVCGCVVWVFCWWCG